LAVLLATVLFSTGGVLVKWIPGHPLAIASLRSVIATPILLAFLRKPRFTWSGAQIGAALAYAGVVVGFVVATKLTTAANAIILQYTSPIYVALLGSWLLQEKTTCLDWLTIAFVFAGLVLFFFDKLTASGLAGNLIAVGSGLCFAFLLVFLRKQKHGSPIESVILGNIITALIGAPFLLRSFPPVSGWLGILLLGVFQLGLPYVLFTRGIRNVTALEAVVIKGIEPILNPLFVYLIIGEKPGSWAFIGAVVVFIAVTGRSIAAAIQSKKKP
jgi:drug/metabolite transporter (DMT)-like permease